MKEQSVGKLKSLYLVLMFLFVAVAVARFSSITSLAATTGSGTESDPYITDNITAFTSDSTVINAMGTALRNKMLLHQEETDYFYIQKTNKSNFTDAEKTALAGMTSAVFDKALEHIPCTANDGDYIRRNLKATNGRRTGTQCSESGGVREYTYLIQFYCKYYTTADEETTLTTYLDSEVAELNLTEKSDYEKVKTIYDYVRLNVTYDYSALNIPSGETEEQQTIRLKKHSTYAAAMTRKSVCQGYSSMLYYMLNKAGIDSRIITGTGNGGAHAWNIVKIDGLWYNVDVTWDSDQGSDKYFLLSEDTFNAGGHARGKGDDGDVNYTSAEYQDAYYAAGKMTTVDNPFKDDGGLDGVKLGKCSVTVYTEINVNYLISIPDTETSTAKVVFTFPNDSTGFYTQEVKFNERGETGYYTFPGDSAKYYKFTCVVPATRLGDAVSAQVVSGTKKSEVFRVSVQKYVNVLLNPNKNGNLSISPEEQRFLEALLHYGAQCQKYFDYNENKLVNAGLTDIISTLNVPYTRADFGAGFTAPPTSSGLSYVASSVVLRSTTKVKHYFKLDNMNELDQYSFYIGGTSDTDKVQPTVAGDYVYIETEGLLAQHLNDTTGSVHVYVRKSGVDGNIMNFRYNPMNYVKVVLTKKAAEDPVATDELVNLVKSLYYYFGSACQAASGATWEDENFPHTNNNN